MTVVNWYPGHMKKASAEIKKQAALCDLIMEVADARLPRGSRNPELKNLIGSKPSLLLLNKMDLTEKAEREPWQEYYKVHKINAVFIAANKKQGFKEMESAVAKEQKKLNDYLAARGRRPRPLRVMMVGIPNSGKSALLNAMVGSNRVKTGNRPGLTRSLQWVRTNKNWELLDSPGMMWPKLDDQETGIKLAVLGSISKDAFPEEESGAYLLNWLLENCSKELCERYKLQETPGDFCEAVMAIAKSRGMINKGGEPKEREIYAMLLKEFRNCCFGKHIMETPGDYDD